MTPSPLIAQVQVLGVRLLGFSADTGRKVFLTLALFAVVGLASAALGHALERLHSSPSASFWGRQAVRIVAAVVIVSGVLSVWFDDPARLTTVIGFITAGIAIALQRVITAFAGYVIILRGKQFSVGDRITIGGVRGDVVALDFMQTTVLEMGQAPGEEHDDPSVWVEARQYTGRLVRVTNDRIFESAVYNYTREFPFVWEELRLGFKYDSDWRRGERIMLDVVERHTADIQREAAPSLAALRRRYIIPGGTPLESRAYVRMTDNWVEFAVRFITRAHGIRDLKSAIARDLLDRLAEANLPIASATFEIVGVPQLRVAGGSAQPHGTSERR